MYGRAWCRGAVLPSFGNFCNFAADLKSNKMKRTVFYILVFTLCSCAVQRATTGIEGMSELSVETLNTLTK